MILSEHFTLSNGVEIPKLGFGTWQVPNGDQTYDAVAAALEAGYRHIDTARAYGNEESVGQAIRDSGIAREEIFVTTKLPAEVKDAKGARDRFAKTQRALDLGHVDLYLIHAPWPWDQRGSDWRDGNIEVWRVFEEIHERGDARAIGVSNFNADDLRSLTGATDIVPHVNQIRFFIGNTQNDVTAYCQSNGILVEGYSPLATGAILDNDDVAAIAKKYDVSVAQLCIRYVLEHDVLPLPKSVTPSRIEANTHVDFRIDPEDLDVLDRLRDTTAVTA